MSYGRKCHDIAATDYFFSIDEQINPVMLMTRETKQTNIEVNSPSMKKLDIATAAATAHKNVEFFTIKSPAHQSHQGSFLRTVTPRP